MLQGWGNGTESSSEGIASPRERPAASWNGVSIAHCRSMNVRQRRSSAETGTSGRTSRRAASAPEETGNGVEQEDDDLDYMSEELDGEYDPAPLPPSKSDPLFFSENVSLECQLVSS